MIQEMKKPQYLKYKFKNTDMLIEGAEFDKSSPRELLQYAIGGMLYMPATRTKIVQDIIEQKNPDIKSICLDLEDSIGDDTVEEALILLKSTLSKLCTAMEEDKLSVDNLPLIFIRVRNPEQLRTLKNTLSQEQLGIITGFNFPKFDSTNAAEYIRAFNELQHKSLTKLYFNPILESKNIMYKQNRLEELTYIQRKLSGFSDHILNIRVGATDFCNIFGIRRKMTQTIYDIGVVTDCFTDIVNFFGKNYVISGPVWEYFNSQGEDGLWKTSLEKELSFDKLNGFFGKTSIHPIQLPVIAQSNIIDEEDYRDAQNIMGMSGGLIGVAKGSAGNKMNEVKTHSNWARKIIAIANVYGVKKGM